MISKKATIKWRPFQTTLCFFTLERTQWHKPAALGHRQLEQSESPHLLTCRLPLSASSHKRWGPTGDCPTPPAPLNPPPSPEETPRSFTDLPQHCGALATDPARSSAWQHLRAQRSAARSPPEWVTKSPARAAPGRGTGPPRRTFPPARAELPPAHRRPRGGGQERAQAPAEPSPRTPPATALPRGREGSLQPPRVPSRPVPPAAPRRPPAQVPVGVAQGRRGGPAASPRPQG